MRRLSFPHGRAVERLGEQASEFVAAAESHDMRLLAPSRCQGWSALDVVVHVRSGLREMAIASATTTAEAPDHDAASYWASHPDDRDVDPVPHILWLRRVASAYARPTAAVEHLKDVAAAAAAAVRSTPERCVVFQGKRMLGSDFLATWVVELAVHQLDLGIDEDARLAESPGPARLWKPSPTLTCQPTSMTVQRFSRG